MRVTCVKISPDKNFASHKNCAMPSDGMETDRVSHVGDYTSRDAATLNAKHSLGGNFAITSAKLSRLKAIFVPGDQISVSHLNKL
jgi:hypothetical protein